MCIMIRIAHRSADRINARVIMRSTHCAKRIHGRTIIVMANTTINHNIVILSEIIMRINNRTINRVRRIIFH